MGRFSATDGVGILWFSREGYTRALTIMTDATDLPDTFDDWQERAKEAVSFIEREGGKPVIVEANIDNFMAYCVVRGLGFDSEGRQMFASDPANWPTSHKH